MLFKLTRIAQNVFFYFSTVIGLIFLLPVNLLGGGNHTIGTQQQLGFLNVAAFCCFLALPTANVPLGTGS